MSAKLMLPQSVEIKFGKKTEYCFSHIYIINCSNNIKLKYFLVSPWASEQLMTPYIFLSLTSSSQPGHHSMYIFSIPENIRPFASGAQVLL